MTVLKTLATLTLHAIHFCIWLKTLVSVFSKWITTKVTEVLKHKGVKVDLIRKDAKQLNKIPFHLALIIAEDQLHYTDLARIVCWAFLAGIQYISIFDQKGEIKRQIEHLKQSVHDQYQLLTDPTIPSIHIACLEEINEATPTLSTDFWLLVLSGEDGRSALVQTAQTLCLETSITLEDIDPSFIEKRLPLFKLIPEPQLAVVCGPVKSILGYPPWSSRLTEIMWLSSHHKVYYSEFYSLLQRYAQSQQRFGR